MIEDTKVFATLFVIICTILGVAIYIGNTCIPLELKMSSEQSLHIGMFLMVFMMWVLAITAFSTKDW